MVNGAVFVVLIGFVVGLVMLVRRGVLTQHRADLGSLARMGSATEQGNAREVLRSLRARNLAAVVAVVAGGFAAVTLQHIFPDAAGLALALAPAGIWVLAASVFAFWRLPHEFTALPTDSFEQSTAELVPRTVSRFGPAWGLMLPAALLATTVLGLLVAGLASGTDAQGRYRNLPYVSSGGAELDSNMVITGLQIGEGAVGPFPGWYYGMPVMVLLLLGTVVGLRALSSNAHRPRLRGVDLRGFDDAVRTNVGYVISTGFSAMLCFQAAPMMLVAASAVSSSGTHPVYTVGEAIDEAVVPSLEIDPAAGALSMGILVGAVLLLVVGATLLLRLLGWLGPTLKPLRLPATEIAGT
ncbi:hypothetical protein [Paeniglutamicibacter antarcticus]|uniref:Uncharacterized protein n=1 Tax=Paeniglutamicibacter antarcticus TaxID=494023 RepID=A0ABP9TK29_9MICC